MCLQEVRQEFSESSILLQFTIIPKRIIAILKDSMTNFIHIKISPAHIPQPFPPFAPNQFNLPILFAIVTKDDDDGSQLFANSRYRN